MDIEKFLHEKIKTTLRNGRRFAGGVYDRR